MKENNIKKNFIWNMLGTGFSAFNSLFFMIIVTRINGVEEAGIFAIAFTLAILFNIIALYAGRVYQVTDVTKTTDADFIFHKILTCLIMIIVTLIYIFISGYDFHKSLVIILLCLYKLQESLSEVFYAIFQKDDDLYKAGISMTTKSLFGLLVLFVTDFLTKDLILSLSCMLLSNIIVILFYDIFNLHKSSFKKEKINYSNIINIFKNGFFAFSIAFLTYFVTSSPKFVIDRIGIDDYQTIFSILIMPATIISLVTQFIIHPFLLGVKKAIVNKDYRVLKLNTMKFSLSILVVGIITTILTYFIGIPFLNFIYGLDLAQYKWALIIIMIGAILYAITSILSTILIAMRYIFIQSVNYFVILLIAFPLCYILINNNIVNGASLAYLFIMVIAFVLFVITIYLALKKEEKKLEV